MCGDEISCSVLGNTWAADDEGDVYIFFEGASFPGGKAVLTDVETVIYIRISGV